MGNNSEKKNGWESFTELAGQISRAFGQDESSNVGYVGVGAICGIVYLLVRCLFGYVIFKDGVDWLVSIIVAVVLAAVMAFFTKKYSK